MSFYPIRGRCHDSNSSHAYRAGKILRSKKRLLFNVLLAVVCTCLYTASAFALELKIETDKNAVGLGDNIIINFHLINVSEEVIRIVPWYRHNWIGIYDEKGNRLREIALVVYDLKIFPDDKDYILLSPKESFDTAFKGTIRNDEPDLGATRPKIKGYWIDFEDRAVVLDGTDKFLIRARYKGDQFWKEEGEKRYGFKNIWVGEVESNAVRISISKGISAVQEKTLANLRKSLDLVKSAGDEKLFEAPTYDPSRLIGLSRTQISSVLGPPKTCDSMAGPCEGRDDWFYSFYKLPRNSLGGGPELLLQFGLDDLCTSARWMRTQ